MMDRPHLFAVCPECGSPRMELRNYNLASMHDQQNATVALEGGYDLHAYTAEEAAEVKARPWFCTCLQWPQA